MTAPLSDRELRIRRKLKRDFRHYASRCLTLRTKAGALERLALNRAQEHLHTRLEHQLKATGRVRAIILKGRQQGCSTYVQGRFYWRVTHRHGVRAFILTHEQAATDTIFEMVERFHAYCPQSVRPHTATANAKELDFDLLDSGYRVGTAGSKATGRSSTVQFFHGSEASHWPNAAQHVAGVLQAVPDEPGTEVILESTANGVGGLFHERWQQAEAGIGDFAAIFIPWWLSDEYHRQVDEDFTLDADEVEYAEMHDLDLGQMAWRRAKIADLGSEGLFAQEYPATPAEAFQVSGQDTLIPPMLVLTARKTEAEPFGAKVVGVDPARFGDDRTAIAFRQGRVVERIDTYQGKDTMEVAGICVRVFEDHQPDQMFIDVGGLGAGVVDRLRELGYGSRLTAVNGGEKPTDSARYFNKRAEMWGQMKAWLENGPVSIPDRDSLHADLTGPSYSYDSNSRLKLEKKEDMKRRGIRSPDEGDALALTFASPVASPEPAVDRYAEAYRRQRRRSYSAWSA